MRSHRNLWSNLLRRLSVLAGKVDFMPKKPLKPCRYPKCPALTDGRYCEAHKKLTDKQYEKYERDPATRKRYGRTWKRIRDKYIAGHPLCEQCSKSDRLTPADEVHHVTPLAKGGTHAEDNLMSLCTPCHSEITARGGGRWGR